MNKFISISFVAVLTTAFSVTFAQNNSKTYDEGVVINGVKWATRNVDAVGTFADAPESAGMFYQWNRKTAWNTTDSIVSGWDRSMPEGDTWEKANDPSPAGWRVPTLDELKTLLKVDNEWTTRNGVSGRLFTDKATGNTLFLPAAGYRYYNDGILGYVGTYGYYWSSKQYSSDSAYYLNFGNGLAVLDYSPRKNGFSVRCVAE